MKKTFKFFAAALAIVAAASCAKEISNDDIQAPEQELVHKVFTASLNVDPATKTTLHTDGVSVHWVNGDKIKLIPSGQYQGSDFTALSIEGTFADFEGETVDADSYRAVYPADAYYTQYSYAGFCSFSDGMAALSTQYAVENDFSASSFNTSTNFAVSTVSKDNHLYFKNINAYFKLSLNMDNASTIEISSDRVEGSGGLSELYDLGGTLNYKYADNKVYLSSNKTIIFKSKDNSKLKSGVTYYIALPAVKVEGLKLEVKDANGVSIASFMKSSFTFEQNKIYNLGTLEPSVEPPFLNVSTTDVSIPKKGGSVTINIDSNVDWNINNLAGSWLTVSKTSDNKGCVFTAQANKESSKRPGSSTNYVIISGGGINHIINVSQDYVTYRIDGSALTRASDLTNGQMYVVRLQSENSRYWYATSSNLSSITQSSESAIPTQCVFVYKKDDSKATKSNYGKSYTKDYVLWKETYYYGNQYSYMSAGGWQSKYNDKYLTHDLGLSNYLDYYFTHMNGWINNDQKNLNTSEDFDIYRDEGSDMLNFNESSYFWGNGGITQYKWSFYKVVEN